MRYSTISSSGPRQLSRGLKAKIIFSHPRAWIGSLFLGIGVLMSAIFAPMSDLHFSNPLDTSPTLTTGTVHNVSQTSATENKKKIYQFDFDYFVDGIPHYGTSYFRGDPGLQAGDEVEVEYDKSNPDFARIKNFRMKPFTGDTFLFMLVFPLVGLMLVIFAFVKGQKNIRLVRDGYLTTAKVLSKAATHKRINKKRVYKVTFEYTATDGMPRQGVVQTHQPERLEDDDAELVLVNSEKPNEAMMVDALPKAVKKFLDGL